MSQPTDDRNVTDDNAGDLRFEFGQNWHGFLSSIDDERIEEATRSLREKLRVDSLQGLRFFDFGSGSGLFSLAAHRLGADVLSVDFDHESVACTRQLREQFAPTASSWQVQQGSVLDQEFMRGCGQADVVYSWGVVHHTGNMRQAIENVANAVKPGGRLFLAIYNDQGGASRRWHAIKRLYNRLPSFMRPVLVFFVAGFYETKFAVARALRLQNPLPFADWRAKKRDRGMSVWHDWVDWIGGLPFEVASPEEVIVPLRDREFIIENLRTVRGGWGCNEYVFVRLQSDAIT